MKELAHEFCSETEPPSWLEPELTAAVTTISASIEGENGFPRREELRNRLSKLHDALSLVSRELRDPAIVNILYGIADGREVPYSETDFLADTIRSYVSEVILLLRAGRGADRHIVNATVYLLLRCVRFMWRSRGTGFTETFQSTRDRKSIICARSCGKPLTRKPLAREIATVWVVAGKII